MLERLAGESNGCCVQPLSSIVFGAVQRGRQGPSKGDALRALAVLERLAGGANAADAGVAARLTEALLPMLGSCGGKGRGKGAAGEAAALRTLGVLAALWAQLGAAPGAGDSRL